MRRNSRQKHTSRRKRCVAAVRHAALGDVANQPDAIPTGTNYEVDVAPDLVVRGPDDRIDRAPICSLPSDPA
jgi:hypothetical protein